MAFEFCPRPVVMPDLFGAIDPQPAIQDNQTDYSMQALERTQNMENLDEFLQGNPELRQGYMSAQRELLVGAGYQAAALERYDEKFS
jgi:hypothetical protein